MSEAMLVADNLTVSYNGVPAVSDFNLSVDAGQVISILGPNGAGKSTTLLALAGLLPITSGRVTAFGRRVDHKKPYALARRGMRLVPDDRGLFASMTVRDHLRLARKRPDKAREKKVIERFPQLGAMSHRTVESMSGGEQQMLAIAVALLADPKILMVDEMSLGLAPIIVGEMLPSIRQMAKDQGFAVLLVEQHVELALAVSDRAIVLNHGRVVLDGSAQSMLANRSELEAAYFGESVS